MSSATERAWRKLWVMRMTAAPASRALAMWSRTWPPAAPPGPRWARRESGSDEPKNIARAMASDWRSPPEMFDAALVEAALEADPELRAERVLVIRRRLHVEELEGPEAPLRLAPEDDVAGHREQLADGQVLEARSRCRAPCLRWGCGSAPARPGSAARRGRAGRRREDLDERGLAGPVVAQQGQDPAGTAPSNDTSTSAVVAPKNLDMWTASMTGHRSGRFELRPVRAAATAASNHGSVLLRVEVLGISRRRAATPALAGVAVAASAASLPRLTACERLEPWRSLRARSCSCSLRRSRWRPG